jgi:hypothetical protein
LILQPDSVPLSGYRIDAEADRFGKSSF